MLGIKPGPAGWEARTLPLCLVCYADPQIILLLIPLAKVRHLLSFQLVYLEQLNNLEKGSKAISEISALVNKVKSSTASIFDSRTSLSSPGGLQTVEYLGR